MAYACRRVCFSGVVLALVLCTTNYVKSDACNKDTNCGNGTECSEADEGYSCTCRTGFKNVKKVDGKIHCQDRDECTADSPCGKNVLCSNTYGSYDCTCQKGYLYKGGECNAVNKEVMDETYNLNWLYVVLACILFMLVTVAGIVFYRRYTQKRRQTWLSSVVVVNEPDVDVVPNSSAEPEIGQGDESYDRLQSMNIVDSFTQRTAPSQGDLSIYSIPNHK